MSADPISPAAETVVSDVRAIETPFEVFVGGSAADFVDTKASLFRSLLWASLIIATVTFVLLFVMFGSMDRVSSSSANTYEAGSLRRSRSSSFLAHC